MNISLNKSELLLYTIKQLELFFPDGSTVNQAEIRKSFYFALERVENCFSNIHGKYYNNQGIVSFNHLNGDHYATFLYYFSNTLYKDESRIANCEKLFLLNKYLHGVDVYYEVNLPDIFIFVHPLGTVLGRADYSNFLVVYQGCNVGANKDVYPKLGQYLSLHPGSSVLGNSVIGDNVTVGANSLVLDNTLGPNVKYVGNPKNHYIFKNNDINKVWKKNE